MPACNTGNRPGHDARAVNTPPTAEYECLLLQQGLVVPAMRNASSVCRSRMFSWANAVSPDVEGRG